jgi:hypothetical protein
MSGLGLEGDPWPIHPGRRDVETFPSRTGTMNEFLARKIMLNRNGRRIAIMIESAVESEFNHNVECHMKIREIVFVISVLVFTGVVSRSNSEERLQDRPHPFGQREHRVQRLNDEH